MLCFAWPGLNLLICFAWPDLVCLSCFEKLIFNIVWAGLLLFILFCVGWLGLRLFYLIWAEQKLACLLCFGRFFWFVWCKVLVGWLAVFVAGG